VVVKLSVSCKRNAIVVSFYADKKLMELVLYMKYDYGPNNECRVGTEAKSKPLNTHNHDRSLSWLRIDNSITSERVKLYGYKHSLLLQ
jgi:hypothetical protein